MGEALKLKYKEFSFRKVREGDIEYIASHMRAADRRELKLMTGNTPEYELRRSVELADVLFVGELGSGEIAGMFGGKRTNLLDETGCIWFLSTDAVDKHRLAFAKASKIGMDLVMHSLPDVAEFENWVDADYKSSVKWIEWLGGTISINGKFPGRLGGEFLNFYMINPYYKRED